LENNLSLPFCPVLFSPCADADAENKSSYYSQGLCPYCPAEGQFQQDGNGPSDFSPEIPQLPLPDSPTTIVLDSQLHLNFR
jgi:hypothetical protein